MIKVHFYNFPPFLVQLNSILVHFCSISSPVKLTLGPLMVHFCSLMVYFMSTQGLFWVNYFPILVPFQLYLCPLLEHISLFWVILVHKASFESLFVESHLCHFPSFEVIYHQNSNVIHSIKNVHFFFRASIEFESLKCDTSRSPSGMGAWISWWYGSVLPIAISSQ